MLIIQNTIDFFYILYLTLKGSNRTRLRPSIYVDDDELIKVVVLGFTLSIYCKELIYKTYYKNKLIHNPQKKIYQLYAKCSNESPDRLKEIVKTHIYLPNLTPNCVSWEISRKQLISAYLDILITRLRELD